MTSDPPPAPIPQHHQRRPSVLHLNEVHGHEPQEVPVSGELSEVLANGDSSFVWGGANTQPGGDGGGRKRGAAGLRLTARPEHAAITERLRRFFTRLWPCGPSSAAAPSGSGGAATTTPARSPGRRTPPESRRRGGTSRSPPCPRSSRTRRRRRSPER